MMIRIKKYWFLLGLFAIFSATLADNTGLVAEAGIWCKSHHGANAAIFIIFLFSGFLLDTGQIKSGIKNVKSILISLVLIFLIAPLISVLFSMTSLSVGIKIGIFLVAVMPTTLSSGVVMTGAAGGNMAGALVTTILANSLAVFTIPVTLFKLMGMIGVTTSTSMETSGVMVKICALVLLPLCLGLGAKSKTSVNPAIRRFSTCFQNSNLFLIILIVWMALSQSRPTIMENISDIANVLISVAIFHAALLTVGFSFIILFQLKPGQRESALLMGCQKTLPLSIILQISLFPQYGIALVVCVLHHFTQLIMDSFVVARLKKRSPVDT